MRQREEIQEVLRRKSAQLIASAIVLFWLVMMALFVRREGLLPLLGASPRPLSRRILEPMDTWMGVYLPNGTRIGFVNTTSTPDIRDGEVGAVVTVTARLRVTLMALPTDVFIAGSAWFTQVSGLSEFSFKVQSGDHFMRVAGAVDAGRLKLEIHTAGEVIPFEFPVPGEDLLLSGGMGTTTLNVPELEPGQEVLIDAFDPMTFMMGKARVKCVRNETIEVMGRPVDTKLLTTSLSGITSRVWVTHDEEIVRVETPFGFTLRKATAQEAFRPFGDDDSSNLLQAVAVQPTGKRPFRGAKRMTVRLSGTVSGHAPPTDHVQSASGEVYTIVVSHEPQAAAAATPLSDDARRDALKSDPFVQADHARIVGLAQDVLAGETDPWRQAKRLYRWVFENIRKEVVFSVPSALEVLETGEGDCNEHTVLYTALARAAGLPTRIAIGLVWSDDLGGFYYHAWPEVYVGDWVRMDPTLGQVIADATHIKLLEGNIETWTQLVPYIGQLQVEVLSIE